MKKFVLLLALSLLSVQLFAVPAQVTFDAFSGSAQFYEAGTFLASERAVDGWYCEIILQSGNAAYNGSSLASFNSYKIAGIDYGVYTPGFTSHATGLRADGSAISTATTRDGKAEISWQFTETAINGYYATWRVYNNDVKANATKYLVLGWQQINVTPGPQPVNETLGWLDVTTRGQMTYDVPPVPEPTSMALLGLTGLALALRKKLRKRA